MLASAVANAIHNDEQDAEELYVKACFADEGPTLKRFTPRARGRAGRIKKRTCHITVIVARLDDARLEVVQARLAKRSNVGGRRRGVSGTSQSRRARVERSRARAAGLAGGGEAAAAAEKVADQVEDQIDDQVEDQIEDQIAEDEVDEATAVEVIDAAAEADDAAAEDAAADNEADDVVAVDDADDADEENN